MKYLFTICAAVITFTAFSQGGAIPKAAPAGGAAAAGAAAKPHKSPEPDSLSLEFVGAANIQKAIDDGGELPASTGLGLILDKYTTTKPLLGGNIYRIFFSGQINVSNNDDSIRVKYDDAGNMLNQSAFGESILRPMVGRNAVDLEMRAFFTGDDKMNSLDKDGNPRGRGAATKYWISGMRIKYTGSNRIWSDSLNSIKTTTNSVRVGLFHDFVGRNHSEDYNIILGAGMIYNSVTGDLGLDRNLSFRESILGNKKQDFLSGEIFAEFRIKNLKANFSYTIFNDRDNIPGFSGGRMITTIGFVGGFPAKLKK